MCFGRHVNINAQTHRNAIRGKTKQTHGQDEKPVCGDSRHDLNYPEIPDSWVELFELFE